MRFLHAFVLFAYKNLKYILMNNNKIPDVNIDHRNKYIIIPHAYFLGYRHPLSAAGAHPLRGKNFYC